MGLFFDRDRPVPRELTSDAESRRRESFFQPYAEMFAPTPSRDVAQPPRKRARVLGDDGMSMAPAARGPACPAPRPMPEPPASAPAMCKQEHVATRQERYAYQAFLGGLTADSLEAAARHVRGRSQARGNCVHLAHALLTYLQTQRLPDPAAVRGPHARDFAVNMTEECVTLKQETDHGAPPVRRVVASTVVHAGVLDAFTPGDTLHYVERADVLELLDEPGVDLTRFRQVAMQMSEVETRLRTMARQAASRGEAACYGCLNLASCISEPGHMLVYVARPDQVWFVDAQRINRGMGQAVHTTLSSVVKFAGAASSFAGLLEPRVFQQRVFLMPLYPACAVDLLRAAGNEGAPHETLESGRVAPAVLGNAPARAAARPGTRPQAAMGTAAMPAAGRQAAADAPAMPMPRRDEAVGPGAVPMPRRDEAVGPGAVPMPRPDAAVGPAAVPMPHPDAAVGPAAIPMPRPHAAVHRAVRPRLSPLEAIRAALLLCSASIKSAALPALDRSAGALLAAREQSAAKPSSYGPAASAHAAMMRSAAQSSSYDPAASAHAAMMRSAATSLSGAPAPGRGAPPPRPRPSATARVAPLALPRPAAPAVPSIVDCDIRIALESGKVPMLRWHIAKLSETMRAQGWRQVRLQVRQASSEEGYLFKRDEHDEVMVPFALLRQFGACQPSVHAFTAESLAAGRVHLGDTDDAMSALHTLCRHASPAAIGMLDVVLTYLAANGPSLLQALLNNPRAPFGDLPAHLLINSDDLDDDAFLAWVDRLRAAGWRDINARRADDFSLLRLAALRRSPLPVMQGLVQRGAQESPEAMLRSVMGVLITTRGFSLPEPRSRVVVTAKPARQMTYADTTDAWRDAADWLFTRWPGCNVHDINARGESAGYLALYNPGPMAADKLRYLVARGLRCMGVARVGPVEAEREKSIMHEAVRQACFDDTKLDIIDLVVANGADVNLALDLWPPDFNATRVDGQPLHASERASLWDKLTRDKGPERYRASRAVRPIHLAARLARHPEPVLAKLLHAGADVYARTAGNDLSVLDLLADNPLGPFPEVMRRIRHIMLSNPRQPGWTQVQPPPHVRLTLV